MLTELPVWDAWVAYWQRRFRLNDWKIKVRVGRPTYKDEAGVKWKCEGLNEWNPGEMTAKIVLNKKATNRTLCHEILHLVLEGEDECKGYSAAVERRIERIVDCIFEVEPKLDDK